MSEPIERFCQFLGEFQPKQRDELAFHCCLCLGANEKPTCVPQGPDVPYGKMFEFWKIQDLRERLTHLADEVRVPEDFLITSLLHHLVDHFTVVSDPQATSRSIDYHLGILERIDAELKQPQAERPDGHSDEYLQGTREQMEEIIAGKPAQREEAAQIVPKLEHALATTFGREYWQGWRLDQLRRRF
jgi:hypothetical protein